MPSLKPFSLLPLLLPLALAACDSGQPSYSASNATTPPPAPAAQPAPPPAQPAPPPPPAAEQTAAAAPSAKPAVFGDRPRTQGPAQQPTSKAIHLPPSEHVGIGSCDDYVSRYRACLEDDNSGTVTSLQHRYQLAQALARQVRGWKIQQSKGVQNGDIARACSEASTQAHDTLGKLGCKSF